MRTVIICPGNGCTDIRNSNWYGQLHDILTERDIPCICENFPDPIHARRDRWVPHIRSLVETRNLSNDEVVLIGHSSGAQATLRYAELYPVYACVLVSATYSDLGDAHERASGYYPLSVSSSTGTKKEETNPYKFDLMRENCQYWYQFHSNDDPFIPLYEAEKIKDGLGLTSVDEKTYQMIPGQSHFFEFSPKILECLLSLC